MAQPNKGDRDLLVSRPARAVGDAVRSRADQVGLSISEYVALVLAEHCGMPELAPTPNPKRSRDEELPLTG